MITEQIIKNVLSELIYGNFICESYEDQYVIDYLYEELLLERLLNGEPVTIPELRKMLKKSIVNFEFIKLDSSVRPARGTTNFRYIPYIQRPKGVRPSSPKVATFYDRDKKDWRSVSIRSKEIVLKRDKETNKPIVVVKPKDKIEDDKLKQKNLARKEEIKKELEIEKQKQKEEIEKERLEQERLRQEKIDQETKTKEEPTNTILIPTEIKPDNKQIEKEITDEDIENEIT